MKKILVPRFMNKGFTLLEMSIVLVIIALVTSGAMVMFTQSLAVKQQKATAFKLQAIQDALFQFRLANNRLPCPADLTLNSVSDSTFGVEGELAGNCATGSTYASGERTVAVAPGPTVNSIQEPAVGAQDAVKGMVPIRTLRLPDDYAIDGWGNRIDYIVSKAMTQNGAFSIYGGGDTTTRMSIKNAAGGTSVTQAIYVLLSHGVNGHGAYSRIGGESIKNSTSTNADELQNCDCNTSASSTGLNGVFVQKEATVDPTTYFNSFDDVVVYATRVDMMLQSSLDWNTAGAHYGLNCAKPNLSCSRSGATKSCICKE
jgi:prepilin-type N-terminal cleavage/methylation domain-containing protein